jgi:hypothetical protein
MPVQAMGSAVERRRIMVQPRYTPVEARQIRAGFLQGPLVVGRFRTQGVEPLVPPGEMLANAPGLLPDTLVVCRSSRP